MEIELTDKERLFLANQYEILGTLKDDDVLLRLSDQLRNGHKWLYDQTFESLYPNLEGEQADLVVDILDLYDTIHHSYERLIDKSGISQQDTRFGGFDGNSEYQLIGFVDALKKDDRFVDIIEQGIRNSHSRKAHIYEMMIERWKTLGQPYELSKEQIIEILGK